ncbi:DUF4442 domain-containing protein [Fulvivirga sediminis]|uniref:YiiD C-terminal domain-containing protein n=1 Tax=Fulvivirga sediminis TaxID=2803949 RepID=A0A937K059_9BACT|nr:DUF4442 domain-containing protein [Fulvivirga sediminis]MBL3657324.1 YiiD C-terminal domain-containing protein [Fulvivirga sediminis]
MKLINWWPPMLGTGISLKKVSDDGRRYEVEMKMRWYNRNLVGIHYGGSLYSMCDPWYMFILINQLGSDYVVMDKGASIRYKKPGKGTLRCVFQVSKEEVQHMKEELDDVGKKDYTFLCEVKNNEGEIITEVEKVVYVRKKNFVFDEPKRSK